MKLFWYLLSLLCLAILGHPVVAELQEFPDLGRCSHEEYIDPIAMQCFSCGPNQTALGISHLSCACNLGYISAYKDGRFFCLECSPDNQLRSLLNETDDDVRKLTLLDVCSKAADCTFSELRCVNETSAKLTCSGFKEASSGFTTVDCSSALRIVAFQNSSDFCQCDPNSEQWLDGFCAASTDFASIPNRPSSYMIELFNGKTFESEYFVQYYKYAAYSCSYLQNSTSCHLLANLCVLLHYSFENEVNACGFYRAAYYKNASDICEYMPWLYYQDDDSQGILKNAKINSPFYFDPSQKNSKIVLKFSTFSPSGEFLSFDTLEESLPLCEDFISQVKGGLHFGVTYDIACKISLQDLLGGSDTYFYEPYLEYYDVEGIKKLHSIPVLNLDYTYKMSKPNLKDESEWQLVRRLFLLDNFTGIEKKKNGEAHLSYVRFLQSVELVVKLRDESSGFIGPPLIKVKYSELMSGEFTPSDSLEVNFSVTYEASLDKTAHVLAILFGVFGAMACIFTILSTWSWYRRNGKSRIDGATIHHFLCIGCGNIADTFFFILLGLCSFWTIFYKHQDVVWIIIPDNNLDIIKHYIISSFALKAIHVYYILYMQISLDLFLIDWEQPRVQSSSVSSKLIGLQETSQGPSATVSIWRTYFIANEWNELQTLRKVDIPFVIFVLIFFLEVLNLKEFTRLVPAGVLELQTLPPYSFICRFSLSIGLYIIIVSVIYLYKTVFYERYIENKLQMFVDLCSMANISVFILKFRLYGFYIHGRSVYGHADSNMQVFYDQLKREEDDLCVHRGLEPSSECQTFEIFITTKFRSKYDHILKPANRIDRKNKSEEDHNIAESIGAHEKMKIFLTTFLQHGIKDLDYIVKEKNFLENVLDLELQGDAKSSRFFKDNNHLFDRTLPYGEERILITFEMMTFTLLDLIAVDYVLAGFVTFCVFQLIRFLRFRGGKKNVVRKTLVDRRFLL